ncbi:MAG: hypothetical protein ABGZ35_31770 [Planctomycetaceae bacterium]
MSIINLQAKRATNHRRDLETHLQHTWQLATEPWYVFEAAPRPEPTAAGEWCWQK